MKKGFSLVELMVAVFIFALIFGVVSLVVRFSSGRLDSAQATALTRNLRPAVEIINLKLNNANGYFSYGPNPKNELWGFDLVSTENTLMVDKIINQKRIVVAATNQGSEVICTFIGRKTVDGIGVLATKQQLCSAGLIINPDILDNQITSKDINITSFEINGSTICPVTNSSHPAQYLTITIKAESVANPNINTELSITNAMDYDTIKYLEGNI